MVREITHPTVIQHPTTSYGPRRDDARPDLVVIHCTAMESAEAALERLCDPAVEVSAHYLICPRGRVWQMVPEEMRAWHAGAGQWGAVSDVNSRSIGIELANRGDHPFAEAQMVALEGLLVGILARWDIPPERVIGHSDMAPGRKIDPGARFDWRRLAVQGLAVWVEPAGALREEVSSDFAMFRQVLSVVGYSPDVPDDVLLEAFRLRHGGGHGPLNARDMARAYALAQSFPNAFPVDRSLAEA